MNMKFLALILVLCLILCGCGASDATEPGKDSTTGETTGATDGAGDATESGELGDDITLPEDLQGQTLPIDFFDDEEGTFSSRPLNTEVPDVTEPTVTEPESTSAQLPSGGDNETLPVDWWD